MEVSAGSDMHTDCGADADTRADADAGAGAGADADSDVNTDVELLRGQSVTETKDIWGVWRVS